MITAQTALSAWIFLPFAAPIAIWVVWSDLARMKIPNKAVLALVAVFALAGLAALPLSEYPWRFVHLGVVLALGFVMSIGRMLGAGDAKFAAAMAPFVAPGDIVMFLYLFSAALLAGFITHRIARRLPGLRRRTPDWESWDRRDYPMGLSLGTALLIYLVIGALWGV